MELIAKLKAFRQAAYNHLCRALICYMGTNGCSVADPERLLLGRLFFMSCVSTQVAKHLRSTARHKTAETKVDAVIHRANAFTGAYRTSRRPYSLAET
jgi:hypothetical protein